MSAMNQSTKYSKREITIGLVGVLCLMILASGFTATGFMLGHRVNEAESLPVLPISLKADAAATGKSLSFATGIVARDIDGLFVLDHLTGVLQCWLLNPKTGQIGGVYQVDVNEYLGISKAGDADFVMVTGRIDNTGTGRDSNLRLASSIVYVGDGNTGNVVGMGFQFNPQLILQRDGNVQRGSMEVVVRGLARGTVERDQ